MSPCDSCFPSLATAAMCGLLVGWAVELFGSAVWLFSLFVFLSYVFGHMCATSGKPLPESIKTEGRAAVFTNTVVDSGKKVVNKAAAGGGRIDAGKVVDWEAIVTIATTPRTTCPEEVMKI